MEQHIGVRRNADGFLEIANVSVDDIASEYGTPLFIASKNKLRANYREFKDAFLSKYEKVAVAYSYKTNYLPIICKILDREGAWAEVVSGFELHLAKKLGVDPNKIVFNGPAKTDEEIKYAIENKIGIINIDSMSELDRIVRISKKIKSRVRLGIRLRHVWHKFGIDVQSGQAIKACKIIDSCKNLRLIGLHVHIGTQVVDRNLYKESVRLLMDFASTIRESLGTNIDLLDLGGGFAVPNPKPLGPYRKNWRTPSMQQYAQAICSVMNDEIRAQNIEKPLLILEPGRAIVSNAFFLLVKVISVKFTPLSEQIVTNGGTNLLPLAPFFEYPIIPVLKRRGEIKEMDVAGPLCMQTDYLGKDRRLPPIKEGDLLLIPDAGAYTLSLSTQFIKPRAGVVFVSDRGTELVRKAETFDHMLALDNLDSDV